MNKINFKKLFLVFAGVVGLMIMSTQVKTYPYTPLKGLFEVLKVDDIGFAYALMHSKLIENVYQYGEGQPPKQVVGRRNRGQWRTEDKNDAVANLVRKFWFRASENHELRPTKFGCLANIPNVQLGNVFGKLINYVYRDCDKQFESALIDELLKCDLDFIQEFVAYLRDLGDEEYRLKDEKFNVLEQAKKMASVEIGKLKVKYKVDELEREIAQASKEWGSKKGFGKEKKRIERRLSEELGCDKAGCGKAVKTLKKRLSSNINKDTQKEYRDIQSLVRKMDGNIGKIVQRKRNAIKKELLKPIAESLTFCRPGNVYMPRTTESILWALFFHKLDDLISREEKIKAINDCIDAIDDRFKDQVFTKHGDNRRLEAFYNEKDFEDFKKKLKGLDADKQVDVVFTNYDIGLHYFIYCIAIGQFSPAICQGSYGYEYEPGKFSRQMADCHETATLDALSVLWYNPRKKAFDDSLFSDAVIRNGKGLQRLREALKYFYLASIKGIGADEYTCKYKNRRFTSLEKLKSLGQISVQEVQALDISEVPVSYITRSEIKQEFMNIVSGMPIPGVIYCSEVSGKGKICELNSDVRNVLKIFNYFYGTQAKTIADLGDEDKGISTDVRKIVFGQENDKNAPNKIKISVSNRENDACFDMKLNVGGEHTYLSFADRTKRNSNIRYDFVEELFCERAFNHRGCMAVLTLSASTYLFNNTELKLDLPVLNLVYYALAMKNPQIKLKIIQDILERRPLQYYDACKGMVRNLLDRYPSNDEHLRGKLNKIIAVSEMYKRDSIFRSWIEKCTKDIFLYDIVRNADNEPQALEIYNEFIGGIEDINKGQVIVPAMKRGYKALVSLIMERKEFDVDKNPKMIDVVILLRALKNGYQDVALKIVNHSLFNEGSCLNSGICTDDLEFYSALSLAIQLASAAAAAKERQLEKDYQEIALKIAKYPTRRSDDQKVLCQALKGGYKEIALAITKSPGFNLQRPCWPGSFLDQIIKLTLEKGYKDVCSSVVGHPTFYSYIVGEKFFKVLLEKGWYKDIALAAIKNPNWKCFGKMLSITLEKRYRDVAKEIMHHPNIDAMPEIWVRNCLVKALERGYKDIASMLMEHKNLNVGFGFHIRGMDHHQKIFLKEALGKGFFDVALKIVVHTTFDANKRCIKKVLDYAQELAKKHPEQKNKLQAVINAIECKRTRKENQIKHKYKLPVRKRKLIKKGHQDKIECRHIRKDIQTTGYIKKIILAFCCPF